MKARTVDLDVWGWGGAIAVGGTFPQFTHFLKRHIQEAPVTFAESPVGYCHLVTGKPWVLWVASMDDPSILAHEALHVACGVLASRGLRLTADSEEAYAYTMQQVVRAAYARKGWKRV